MANDYRISPKLFTSKKRAKGPKMRPGYAFEYSGPPAHYLNVGNDDWETVMRGSHIAGLRFVGSRSIDGSPVYVWQAGPGHYYAQTQIGG
jgi:hypothetical protein